MNDDTTITITSDVLQLLLDAAIEYQHATNEEINELDEGSNEWVQAMIESADLDEAIITARRLLNEAREDA
jgi:hypothetical protein